MRKHYGTKRFKVSDIEKRMTIILGSNGSGKTRSMQALKRTLEDRDQQVVYLDVAERDYTGYDIAPSKTRILQDLMRDLPDKGYILLDNLDRVLDYPSMVYLLKDLTQRIEQEEYLYIICTSNSFDMILATERLHAGYWNNETGRKVNIETYLPTEYRTLFYTRTRELNKLINK